MLESAPFLDCVDLGTELPVHWRMDKDGLVGRTAWVTLRPGDGPWDPPLQPGQVWMVRLASRIGDDEFLVEPLDTRAHRGTYPLDDREVALLLARSSFRASSRRSELKELLGRTFEVSFTYNHKGLRAEFEGRSVYPDRDWRDPFPEPNRRYLVEVVGETKNGRAVFVTRANSDRTSDDIGDGNGAPQLANHTFFQVAFQQGMHGMQASHAGKEVRPDSQWTPEPQAGRRYLVEVTSTDNDEILYVHRVDRFELTFRVGRSGPEASHGGRKVFPARRWPSPGPVPGQKYSVAITFATEDGKAYYVMPANNE
ncbi:MAG: hypothetical protein U0136_13465 [Bdellovibrionota bacterium]